MLAALLGFAKNYEIFIYLALGLCAIWFTRKLSLGWKEYRSAAFGLERESAQRTINGAASVLVFVFIVGVIEFVLVSFVVPTVPDAAPLPTATLDLLASPTTTLDPTNLSADATPAPTVETEEGGCIPGLVEITSPDNGETIQDVVEIIGTADIPNFGFYKFEMAAINDPTWLTIQAGETITTNGRLGFWDTTRLNPGDFALRLIVTDNEGNSVEPCVIQVRVDPPSETEQQIMPEVEIRPAIATDIHALMELEHNYSSDFVWQMDFRQENMEVNVTFKEMKLPRSVQVTYPRDPQKLADTWTQRDGLLVAVADDAISGYISLTQNTTLRTTWATDLIVRRRMRRQGIGSALVIAAQTWATQNDSRRLILEMQPKNHPAIQLVKKLGFELCGYNDHYFSNHDIALFFSKWLR